ncbi:MAG: ethanolamine utilization protein EutN [Opitutales bacterium]|nr:ethanolamine utilization protein EutN [Opitutales bacterium]
MRLGTVIGRLTMSQVAPGMEGARWLLVSPATRKQMPSLDGDPVLTAQPSLVVYDDLGAGVGDVIGFVEGREAASPFVPPIPIDAINAAIIDRINFQPLS